MQKQIQAGELVKVFFIIKYAKYHFTILYVFCDIDKTNAGEWRETSKRTLVSTLILAPSQNENKTIDTSNESTTTGQKESCYGEG